MTRSNKIFLPCPESIVVPIDEEVKILKPTAWKSISKKDNNTNYAVSINITNLAEVSRLQPAKKAYLVWAETEDRTYKNVGQINSDETFISSKLKAKFETVTSFKPIKIFITAEDDINTQQPAKKIILTTKNF